MRHKWLRSSFSGALLLVLVPASHAADMQGDIATSPPPEAAVAPADIAVPPSADAAVAPQPQVAVETPVDERMSHTEEMAADPCAGPSASGSLDCEKLKRKVSADRTAKVGTSALCTSHMDAKGAVIYDDPTCPSRMGGTVVTDAGTVYLIRENPFFNLHIEKAVEHAKAAEIAGNQGQAADLMEHAQMSLVQAKEAQRAGNVAGLNEGIISLREALRLPEGSSVREATAYVRDARKNLSQAGGMKYKEIQPQGVIATSR